MRERLIGILQEVQAVANDAVVRKRQFYRELAGGPGPEPEFRLDGATGNGAQPGHISRSKPARNGVIVRQERRAQARRGQERDTREERDSN